MCTILHRLVYEAVRQVPPGRVTTYKAIAEALGDPIAARAVAKILSENRDPLHVPCHRVVKSDGSLGGYALGGEMEKRKRLEKEGVKITDGRIDLDRYIYTDIDVCPILEKMKITQRTLSYLNRKRPFEFEIVVGVDVAYRGCEGFGVAVAMDLNGNIVGKGMWKGSVDFPYVPTYLGFREAKFMVKSVEALDREALLLVDGQGTAHPRGAGEAVHVGAVLDMPSLGVAKSPLMRWQKPHRGAYISPGWMLPPPEIVDRVWMGGRKQPRALELAHREATRWARESA